MFLAWGRSPGQYGTVGGPPCGKAQGSGGLGECRWGQLSPSRKCQGEAGNQLGVCGPGTS